MRNFRMTAFMAVLSSARLIAALLFSSLAFQSVPISLLNLLYGLAILTDFVDGYLARKLKAESHFGQVLDVISDKALTVVSLLYAAARGVNVLPLALIAARELISLGLRSISVDGAQVLPTSRFFGGFMAIVLWGNTLALLNSKSEVVPPRLVDLVYWASALILLLNLGVRIYRSAGRIKTALSADE